MGMMWGNKGDFIHVGSLAAKEKLDRSLAGLRVCSWNGQMVNNSFAPKAGLVLLPFSYRSFLALSQSDFQTWSAMTASTEALAYLKLHLNAGLR